jgi:hypothetical protein
VTGPYEGEVDARTIRLTAGVPFGFVGRRDFLRQLRELAIRRAPAA